MQRKQAFGSGTRARHDSPGRKVRRMVEEVEIALRGMGMDPRDVDLESVDVMDERQLALWETDPALPGFGGSYPAGSSTHHSRKSTHRNSLSKRAKKIPS